MSVTGANAILRRLGSIKTAIDRGIFYNAVVLWAEREFIPRVVALVPVDTGALRDSIGFEATSNQVFVFASAPHANHVEFGTFKMTARPYFRPALRASRRLLSTYTRRALREAMR